MREEERQRDPGGAKSKKTQCSRLHCSGVKRTGDEKGREKEQRGALATDGATAVGMEEQGTAALRRRAHSNRARERESHEGGARKRMTTPAMLCKHRQRRPALHPKHPNTGHVGLPQRIIGV